MGHPPGLIESLRTAAPHIAGMGRLADPGPSDWERLPWPLPEGWLAEWKTPDYREVLTPSAAELVLESVRLIAFAYRPPSFFMYARVARDDVFALAGGGLPQVLREQWLGIGRTGPMPIAVDDRSTSSEVLFQLLMHAWWRGGADSVDVLRELARAYPAAARIAREGADEELALARLFDPLHRGLDVDRGAKAIRGYVRRLATAIREESRSQLSGIVEARASRLGVSRSGYYKAVRRLGVEKDHRGYYQVGEDLEADLLRARDESERRKAAVEFLVRHGVKYEAARRRVRRKGPLAAVRAEVARTHIHTHKPDDAGGTG